MVRTVQGVLAGHGVNGGRLAGELVRVLGVVVDGAVLGVGGCGVGVLWLGGLSVGGVRIRGVQRANLLEDFRAPFTNGRDGARSTKIFFYVMLVLLPPRPWCGVAVAQVWRTARDSASSRDRSHMR